FLQSGTTAPLTIVFPILGLNSKTLWIMFFNSSLGLFNFAFEFFQFFAPGTRTLFHYIVNQRIYGRPKTTMQESLPIVVARFRTDEAPPIALSVNDHVSKRFPIHSHQIIDALLNFIPAPRNRSAVQIQLQLGRLLAARTLNLPPSRQTYLDLGSFLAGPDDFIPRIPVDSFPVKSPTNCSKKIGLSGTV